MSEPQVSPPVAALLRRASEDPDRVVLVADGEHWTSGRLVDESARLAAGLVARGVRPRDRVALHLHTTLQAALAYLACLRAGATAVPLNTRLTTPELGDLVARTQPVVYLGQPSLYDGFAPVSQRLVPDSARFLAPDTCTGDGTGQSGGAGAWAELTGSSGAFRDVGVDLESPAVLLSTSGTTGRSKIAVWSHATLGAFHLTAAAKGITKGDVFEVTTSVMHAGGLYCLLSAVTEGATAVLVAQFDAGAVLDAMERHGCTGVTGLPFMCAELAREQREHPRQITTLRVAIVAGDTCPADVEAQFQDAFAVPLRSAWGATEEPGATVPTEEVGPYMRVIPEARVQVVDEYGAPVRAGQTGEFLVSSPTTSPGYWQSETETTAFSDGVFHSGDLVRQRGPGVLEYVGRVKDIIIRGGSNIAPGEVEEALRRHPEVLDAAVVGVPDPDLGQRVGALLVMAQGATSTPEQVLAHVAEGLAAYKIPERVRTVAEVPRNRLMKIDRDAALTMLESGQRPS